MSKGIRLSEKHGVNPSLDCCFFCGEPKGLVLLGKLKGDVAAPREVITSYDPCEHCAAIQAQGVTFIEVVETELNRPQIQEGLWPTGRTVTINPVAVPNFKMGDTVLMHEDTFKESFDDVLSEKPDAK